MIKPLYLICGLLDSGKTSLVKETLYNPRFNEGERTMILTFEMGEEEYDEKFLKYAKDYNVAKSICNDIARLRFERDLYLYFI